MAVGYYYQFSKFLETKISNAYYTPDAADIYTRRRVPLFVYGLMKRGLSFHSALDDNAEFLGYGMTAHQKFTMYHKKTLPYVFGAIDQEIPGSIFGELYMVPPDTLRMTDFYESNRVDSFRIPMTINYQEHGGDPEQTRQSKAWMYICSRGLLHPKIGTEILPYAADVTPKGRRFFNFYAENKNILNATHPETETAH